MPFFVLHPTREIYCRSRRLITWLIDLLSRFILDLADASKNNRSSYPYRHLDWVVELSNIQSTGRRLQLLCCKKCWILCEFSVLKISIRASRLCNYFKKKKNIWQCIRTILTKELSHIRGQSMRTSSMMIVQELLNESFFLPDIYGASSKSQFNPSKIIWLLCVPFYLSR